MGHKCRHTHRVRKIKTCLASQVTHVHRIVNSPTFDPSVVIFQVFVLTPGEHCLE